MIPLGAMVMSFLAEFIGIIETFVIMGISTFIIAFVFSVISRQRKMEAVLYDASNVAVSR